METGLKLSVCAEPQGRQRLRVAGSLTLGNAVQFKEALVASLAAAQEITLDLSGMTTMDLSGLQLICAAHRSADRDGKLFTVQGGSAGYRSYLGNAGVLGPEGNACGTARRCLWRDEETREALEVPTAPAAPAVREKVTARRRKR